MRIIVDGMGGDNAPLEIVKACVQAVEQLDTDIVIVGKQDKIEEVFASQKLSKNRIEIVDAQEEILMDDEPISVRHKKDSSMAKGLYLLRDGEGDAFVSAGNSGALLVGSTLFVRCIKGVRRAAFAPTICSVHGKFILADSGANIDADFCVIAQGDSMINARIMDGDIVFVRKQEMVENGEIAVVIVNDNEVTLKRFFYYPELNQVVLQPENPAFRPMVYMNEELSHIRVLGKAVAFTSSVI